MTTPTTHPPQQPHLLEAGDILEALATDVESGLSSVEAARRLEQYGRNELEAAEGPSVWSRVVTQFSDPLVIMLIVAMLISLLAWFFEGGEETPYEPIVIAIILIANAALGLWQELKADNAVAELQKMTATQATVWRDGERLSVRSAELVPGDILLLSEGDAVSADARVVTSESLRGACSWMRPEPKRLCGPARVRHGPGSRAPGPEPPPAREDGAFPPGPRAPRPPRAASVPHP